jgi:hypothetical protein
MQRCISMVCGVALKEVLGRGEDLQGMGRMEVRGN